MTEGPAASHKALLAPFRAALYDDDAARALAALSGISAPDAVFRLCHPLGDCPGPDALFDTALCPLAQAWPDLERRETIVIEGATPEGAAWVGCAGFYAGTFLCPWLDIPPTGHVAAMRFHEFFRIEAGRIVEMQALWDIPEVMMQARAWPMAPSLGRDWQVPGPATGDGVTGGAGDAAAGRASRDLVIEMLTCMKRHPAEGGPEVMEVARVWHPKMMWYGPAGIGTGRGIAGFRHWHQIPFLRAMPDRGQYAGDIDHHFFGEGAYAAVTGWPDMIQTLTHDGWLGIAPGGRRITMRSLDFWRIENGLIRENRVLVDLLDAYAQLGVDVFARLRDFNKARNIGPIDLPDGISA